MRFLYEVTGKLTKKQEQKLETIAQIISGFYDRFENKQELTIKELKQETGLSSGVLSKHLQELVEKDIVKGTVKVHNNRLTMVFEHDDQTEYKIKGLCVEKVKDVVRAKMMQTGFTAQRGHLARGKLGKDKKTNVIKRSWRFIPEKEKQTA